MPNSSTAARTYLSEIQGILQRGNATEHTYRAALQAFLESVDTGLVATNEAQRIECGAPDFTISQRQRTLGYIEAKDVATDLGAIERDSNRANPATTNGQQLKRYRQALGNLILTDYLEFRWYVHGERRGEPVRLADLDASGRPKRVAEGEPAVMKLLGDFLAHEPEPIADPKELAQRLARLTHLIRDMVVESFHRDTASTTVRSLRDAFAEVLIPDLSVTDFADMYAQTLAYGLFAARVQHDPSRGPFRRRDASYEIPRTNPFLRRLFDQITGPDMDDEPFAGLVDDLGQLLAETDMAAVLADFGKRTRQQDPVVHFYETFLGAYDPKLREKRGVYYTPEPVVSYIVRSVDYLLRTSFNIPDGLADTSTASYQIANDRGELVTKNDPRVLVLDPACGTGTFLYSIVDHIRSEFMARDNAGRWPGYVAEGLLPRLFGFELLMAPYAVAHLKLGMQLAAQDLPESKRKDWAYDFSGGERLGVYLTNTLDEAIKRSQVILGHYISDEANEAAEIKKDKPVLVVLGNPPYSGHSANRSETARPVRPGQSYTSYAPDDPRRWVQRTARREMKVREPTEIGKMLRDYYFVDGQPLGERTSKWLQDDYVKFIRFGESRINQTGSGILTFISNNGYLDNPTFRGMRNHLMNSFTSIYLLNLHGSSRKGELTPDGAADQNVFEIQQGVTIGIFVKDKNDKSERASVYYSDLWGMREEKYKFLSECDISNTAWVTLYPESPSYVFVAEDVDLRSEYDQGWKLTDIMPVGGAGMTTARDHVVIADDPEILIQRAQTFANSKYSDRQACQALHIPMKNGWDVRAARQAISREQDLSQYVKAVRHRPFDDRLIFYHDSLVWRTARQVMEHMVDHSNLGLLTTRQTKDNWDALVTPYPVTHKALSAYDITSLFPVYLYRAKEGSTGQQWTMTGLSPWAEGEDGRRPNLNPEIVHDLEHRLGLTFVPDGRGDLQKTFGPEDVFHYIYAVLHSPEYRQRYAQFLKIDFPRVPITSDLDLFRSLAGKGAELVAIHLLESPTVRERTLKFPVRGDNIVESGHPRYVPPGEPEPGTQNALTNGRVYISKGNAKQGKEAQYFEGVPPEVWEFHVGGYQVCEKWLKDRKGRTLTNADIEHYERIVNALQDTIRLMEEVDEVIETHGGWPLK